MNRTRSALFAAGAAIGLAALTACGGGNYQATGKAPGPAEVKLAATQSTSLGAIVADSAGHTLYRFDADSVSPSKSNCNDACALIWPPALAGSGDPALAGIEARLVGTVTRADGSKQLTLNGSPLYRFSKDSKPGDTLGQGIMGTWFASTPDGDKASAHAVSDGTADSDGDDGYGY
jgi:predicted lipoprotein with Yx(FWY)xxD motif